MIKKMYTVFASHFDRLFLYRETETTVINKTINEIFIQL